MKLIFTKPVAGNGWFSRDTTRKLIVAFLDAQGLRDSNDVALVSKEQVFASWNSSAGVWHVSICGKIDTKTGDVINGHVQDAALLVANGNAICNAYTGETHVQIARLISGEVVVKNVKRVGFNIVPSN